MYKKIILLIFFLLFLDTAFAATIHGSIYDYSLDKVNDAILEVNSQPKQYFVAKNGTYVFNLPIGEYIIKVEQYKDEVLVAYTSENISVVDDGNYVLDLILFPSFIEEDELVNEKIDIPEDEFTTTRSINLYLIDLLLILILVVIFYFLNKKRKKSKEDNDLERIIKIIKEHGGRTTQKEIRKQLPLSEAKISLMITELEHGGVIKKIKKGRGNIIIFK